MKLIFYYDYACPFCFLATDIIRGLAGEFCLETEWLGIEIHPELPPGGKRRRRTERTVRLAETLANMARENGTEIRLPGFAANSRFCLEAAEFAKEKGKFPEFHKACYEAYFTEGMNIGLLETVAEIAGGAGLPIREVREVLERKSFAEKTDENMKRAVESMVLGVPTLCINGLRIHGTQSREVYGKLIAKELERRKPPR